MMEVISGFIFFILYQNIIYELAIYFSSASKTVLFEKFQLFIASQVVDEVQLMTNMSYHFYEFSALHSARLLCLVGHPGVPEIYF